MKGSICHTFKVICYEPILWSLCISQEPTASRPGFCFIPKQLTSSVDLNPMKRTSSSSTYAAVPLACMPPTSLGVDLRRQWDLCKLISKFNFTVDSSLMFQNEEHFSSSRRLPVLYLLLCEAIQHILGAIFAVVLVRHSDWLLVRGLPVLSSTIYRILSDTNSWLGTARPAGLKLHAELAHLYCVALDTVLRASASLSQLAAAWHLQPLLIQVLAIAGCLGGLTGMLSAFLDILDFFLIPAALLIQALAACYGLHLRFLYSTWCMLRGSDVRKLSLARKINFKRNTQSALKTESGVIAALLGRDKQETNIVVERLLVGVLFFVPLLALFPTTLVWYITASIFLILIPATLRWVVRCLIYALQLNPVALMIWLWFKPQDFQSGSLRFLKFSLTQEPCFFAS
ncbi:hypothetical protein CEUSTIGMA_g385.t1 [Chlamydomonas eustigma]|uniref:Uncharacterized protein n=1 Tax=Chlamydomonas eustigma TaxID=1157962 RepID=A0A250WQV0_9CHLO|nr:hypothetical protein CEUSTIGMA_g385.t1 [Chlamydomonas eustigma]|eukprot:GAX72930.1 hypothetical protein CEUSTIGMA_g385.t1 [Chlamydomonas eustigma]